MINYLSQTVINLCFSSKHIHFISHLNFEFNGDVNYNSYWKDMVHTNRKGLQKLVGDCSDAVSYSCVYC